MNFPTDSTSSMDRIGPGCDSSNYEKEASNLLSETARKDVNQMEKYTNWQFMHAHIDELEDTAVVCDDWNVLLQQFVPTPPYTVPMNSIDNATILHIFSTAGT